MYGVTGKVLRVNLTDGKTKVQRFEEEFYKRFLGGVGLGAKILFNEVPPEVDPLDPENRLVFAIGPFQGTPITSTGRWSVSARSPLTGIWGEASSSGSFGIQIRAAGFDGIVVQGKAESPMYLWVHNERVETKDASQLWGLDSYQTYDKIESKLSEPNASIVAIGQAGENLVKTANIVNDKSRFAGRSGMGAVMGSKKLKAVAVFGTSKQEVANPEKLKELNNKVVKRLANASARENLCKHGTPYFLPLSYDYRNVPIKNWTMGDWTRGVLSLSAPRLSEVLSRKRGSCPPVCPIACRGHMKVEKPEKYACEGQVPEYETLGLLGMNLLIGDAKAVAKIGDLCNRFGMDTISTGSTIGVIMECYEKGILTREDIDGLDLKWGNADVVIELVKKIANRDGIGDKLAEGSIAAAKKIGKEAVKMVQHVKGLDFPAHDPRAIIAQGLNYATGSRGACHVRGFVLDHYQVYIHPQAESVPPLTIPELDLGLPPKSTWRGQSPFVANNQDWACIFNSLIQCLNPTTWGKDKWGLRFGEQLALLNYVTGWDLSPQEYIKIGERIFNLQRAFNVRNGISRKDDQLPPRIFEKVNPNHNILPLSGMLDEYYEYRGWTPDGIPIKEKLLELDLKDAAKALWS